MMNPVSSAERGITFAVDDAPELQGRINEYTVSEHLTDRFGCTPFAISCDGARLIVETSPPARSFGIHPLLEAIHMAFARHLPLVLSPDAIWLVIAQGFGQHVGQHAETLRPRFVRHQGRQGLEVEIEGPLDSPDSWRQAVRLFSERIRQETDPVIHETLVANFSTTTEDIRTASEIVLMDAFTHYFDYVLWCVCGIPEITLQGTPADWQRIRDRVEVLATFELNGWVERLRPILDHFIRASEGHPEVAFWQAIYKPQKAYATTVFTGWIGDLFPYVGDPPQRRPNPLLQRQRTNWAVDEEFAASVEGFPCGMSLVPLQLENEGQTRRIDLAGGFLGIDRRWGDSALSPLIGWTVLSGDRIQPRGPEN